MADDILLELAADIVTAHVSNNPVSTADLPLLIQSVYGSLAKLGQPVEAVEEKRTPAVSIRASVKSDAIACLECGAKLKTLKRHLGTEHGLTAEEYRARWNLAADYPLIAPDYAARRKALAIEIGLGRKGGRKKAPAKAPAKSAPKSAPKSPVTAGATPEKAAPTLESKRRGRNTLGVKFD
ncbi:MucR family transcriptional regulator [Novosphingobium sp. PhB165]|uniref:MucR family transcriptional regulator n=1 Tax=Novosphingobium sp. PhB165 TaxID=2485105 RepID=UPI00104B6F54|nr:MucR family transcriptional regulator [Novosphingobium sp. PhB165]TCM21646.1 MucR family transcriptional regulator [Novosphingobium sp. PhB165]